MSSSTLSSKRASSSTSTPSSEHETKRAKKSDAPPKQYVYVVLHETSFGGDHTAVEGVFSTVEDATNGLKKIVNREYIHLYEDVEEAGIEVTERNGLVKWHSSDAGEGEESTSTGLDKAARMGVESGDEDVVEEKQEDGGVEDMEE
ncbi:hypothetical protein H4I96_05368 [Botrytis cinerea]